MRLKTQTTLIFTTGAARQAVLVGMLFYSLVFTVIALTELVNPALGTFPVGLERLVYVLNLPLEVVLIAPDFLPVRLGN